MTGAREPPHADRAGQVSDAVEAKSGRMRRGRAEKRRGLMFGLGFMGLIGWSVALPALGGVALGLWLDRAAPASFSWTLTLLGLGVGLGAANAWMWAERFGRRDRDAKQEEREPRQERQHRRERDHDD